jgi:hypothetical protein
MKCLPGTAAEDRTYRIDSPSQTLVLSQKAEKLRFARADIRRLALPRVVLILLVFIQVLPLCPKTMGEKSGILTPCMPSPITLGAMVMNGSVALMTSTANWTGIERNTHDIEQTIEKTQPLVHSFPRSAIKLSRPMQGRMRFEAVAPRDSPALLKWRRN